MKLVTETPGRSQECRCGGARRGREVFISSVGGSRGTRHFVSTVGRDDTMVGEHAQNRQETGTWLDDLRFH